MDAPQIVQKIWNYCDVLRDEGISYGNYVQQLTYILFLKMADEQTKPPFNKKSIIPKGKDWDSLLSKSGEELETHYRHILEFLAKEKGLLGVIYRKSKSEIQDPAKLERLIKLINEETWVGLDVDVKGEIYEGLLQKNAEGTNGAGQYFTPRALIQGIVAVIKPQPMQTIGDTSCGTGGFFLASHDYIDKEYNLDKEQKKFLKQKTFKGWDIVPEVVRLCAMNMYLHGIGDKQSQVIQDDSLAKESGDRFDIIMTNPPFGKKSSYKIMGNDGTNAKESMSYARDDFWATSSNKQLNFLQHVKTQLKINGKCAIVVPDNVLFEGGSGETVRKKLLSECDVHTLLRLPTGLFYAQGVKANVLFFDKKPASENNWTKKLWIYDLRTNKHFTLKENNLKFEDMKDFIKCYNADNISERKGSKRFKAFDYDTLLKRDNTSLDIFWIKDESLEDLENLPEPKVIAEDITENLKSALDSMKQIMASLNSK